MNRQTHHEGPDHHIRHLGQLVVQQGGGGVVCYLTTTQPIRALHTQLRYVQVRTGKSYLLEHLILRLGPDVQLRRTDRQVSMETDRQTARQV